MQSLGLLAISQIRKLRLMGAKAIQSSLPSNLHLLIPESAFSTLNPLSRKLRGQMKTRRPGLCLHPRLHHHHPSLLPPIAAPHVVTSIFVEGQEWARGVGKGQEPRRTPGVFRGRAEEKSQD